MGDRANFGFKQSNGQTIMLYGHWAGYQMLAQLANAVIAARPRWTDESYATRICVSQLVGEDWNKETGWGLSVNEILDNEHKIPVVDWSTQTFALYEEGTGHETIRGLEAEPLFTMDLISFCQKYTMQTV